MDEHILVADDEVNLRRVLRALLRRQGYEVTTVADGVEALEALETQTFSVVLTDLRMPRLDGMGLLREIRKRWGEDELPVIMLTAHGTVDTAVEAMKRGNASNFITKPFDKYELTEAVKMAVAARRLSQAASRGHVVSEAEGRFGLIGTSPAMQRVFKVVEKVASTPSTVLITGESGTGKELIAKALHEHSTRADKPFIRVNCAAIPDTLIESELFGYEKGAFTGAVANKPGRFELAHEGTLFLDEIGEISTEMQVKLLRAIQESEFERVGGISTHRVNVRLVAATNRKLAEEVAAGRFREDLYYRLNVVPIALPPLRDRIEDIPRLVEHLLVKYAKRLGSKVTGLTEAAHAVLLGYGWPGNIRELENMIERTVLFCDETMIDAHDLPDELSAVNLMAAISTPDGTTGLKDAVRQTTRRLEQTLIERALEQTGGNVTQAAKRLEISRKSLQTKMKEFGLRES